MNDKKRLGVDGEKEICRILRERGCPVRKSDGHVEINGTITLIEAKNKSRYWRAPPFDGHGTDKEQIDHYLKIYHEYGLRTILFVPGKDGGWIWNYIDELIKGNSHLTKSKILVFPFRNYRLLDSLNELINPTDNGNISIARFAGVQ